MVARTKVVISTVGPYIQFGEPLVAACAEAGTDYVDLTGEPLFVDLMYVAYHDDRREVRRPDRELLRLRLDPARPRRLLHGQGAGREGPGRPARRGPGRCHRLGRHVPLGDGHPVPGPGDARRGQGPAGGRAQARGSLVEGRGRQAAPRQGARLVAAAAAHHRRHHRGPQRGRAAGVRTPVHLLPLRRRQEAVERRRRRRGCGRRHGLGPGAAAEELPARPDQAGRRARRGPSGQVVVQRRLRRRGRRTDRAHPGQWRRPGLRRDVEDARRVGAVPGLRRQPEDRPGS